MGRKKNRNIDRPKTESKKDREPSFFDNIVLKEKKVIEKPKAQPKKNVVSSGKKPGEIVQGYNPSMSFADILYSFEKTGNPYSMPKPKAGKSNRKESFGDILDQWEGKGKSNVQKRVENVRNTYTPTKSFAEILSSYESSGKSVQAKKKQPDRMRVADILVKDDTDQDSIEKVESKNKQNKSLQKGKSKYQPKQDFATILDQFEGKPIASDNVEIKIEETPEVGKDEVVTTSFFRKEDEDNKIATGVTWSILGGAQERPVVNDVVDIHKDEPKEIKRVSAKYEPTIDFASILNQFEGNGNASIACEQEIIKEMQNSLSKIDNTPETTNLFREEDEDNKVEKNVAWSILGGRNESFVRPERKEPEHEELPKYVKSNSSYKKQGDFSSILNSFDKNVEDKPSEVVKTFEEILAEKGDLVQQKPSYSLTKLRTMIPQATLDLHGETQAEAEGLIVSFLNEAVENGLRKVCIITGKGLHSESGEGVLRATTERVLENSGLVSEKNNAPLNAGGSGALWIILKA